mgnify:CR=1 FL=1
MSTTKEFYCAECSAVTEHAKISYSDIQALKKLYDQKADRNDGMLWQVYKKYPSWVKDINFGFSAVTAPIINTISQYFLGKDFGSIWVCSKCHNVQNRTLE